MSVEPKNQVWLEWSRCRDGYKILEEADGSKLIGPLSVNKEAIHPLEMDAVLFRQFAELKSEKTILEFVTEYGLGTHPVEREPLGVWQVEPGRIGDAIKAWEKGDHDGLCTRFNELRMVPANFRLEPQPRRNPPALYYQPKTLIDGLWVQFAHAVSQNKTQRRCDYCHRWHASQTKRRKFCSDKCRNDNFRKGKEQKQ